MAIVHNGKNELKEKANQSLRLAIIFFIPPILYILAFIQGFHFDGIFHLFPFLIGGIGTYYWRKYSALRSGIKGEEQTSKVLEGLPEGYEVFSSLQLETNEGRAEYDHIIVGKNGVFVVEVKNHNGTIEGTEEDKSWTQHKVGRKGGRYTNQMRNPIKQVKRQVFILSNYMKQRGSKVWIEGVVFFSNPRATVHVVADKTPVFNSTSQLNNYLMAYEPRRKISKEEVEQLKKLLAMTLKQAG